MEKTALRPLSVQLYSARTYSAKDGLRSVVEKMAEIGYKGVEPAGFFELRPRELKKLVEDLGMKIYSSHSPWVRENNVGECMELAESLGLDRVVCGYGPNDFKDMDAIKRTAELTNKNCEILKRNGFKLFQHNHYWEFDRLDGRVKYEIYAEMCPDVQFQIDTFWATNLGREDAVAMMKPFADRTVLLHIKDGVFTQNVENAGMNNGLLDIKADMMPLGTGKLPIKDIVANMPEKVDAVIVELDYCNTEMYKALQMSYDYMVQNGLAAGNK